MAATDNFVYADGTPYPDNYFDKSRFVVKALGDEILQNYHFIAMSDNPSELYVYEGGVYTQENAKNVIRTWATRMLDDRVTQSHIEATEYYIQTLSLTKRAMVNADITRINLKNGIFNLKTWTLEPHTSDYLSTQQIPVEYDPSAECPNISKFLMDILTPAEIALILQLFGYMLIPNRDIQKAFMFTGSGSNGKGTLTRLMGVFVGSNNSSSISLQKLNDDKFAVANLYGKLVNICGDIPSSTIEDDYVFKAITGKDTLHGERKYETGFDFNPVARLVFSANDIPRHPKGGYAWNRRWIIINFLKTFSDKTDDKDLDSKLQTPCELSGLLNLALTALEWLLETKEYYYFKTPDQVGQEYLLKSDPLEIFLKECTIPSDEFIRKSDLYNIYELWAKSKKLNKILPNNIFGKIMKNKGFIETSSYENGKQLKHLYDGISLNLSDSFFKTGSGGQPVLQPVLLSQDGVFEGKNTPNKTGSRYFHNLSIADVLQQCRYGNCILGETEQFILNNPSNPSNPPNNENIKTVTPPEQDKQFIEVKEQIQITPLTKMIIDASQEFGKSKGIVNSSNLVAFSMWTVEKYKPQWQDNGNSGYYTPSAIKGLAARILKITPETTPGAANHE